MGNYMCDLKNMKCSKNTISICLKKIYPKKFIFYTDNIRASMTNCMSACSQTGHRFFNQSFLYAIVQCSSINQLNPGCFANTERTGNETPVNLVFRIVTLLGYSWWEICQSDLVKTICLNNQGFRQNTFHWRTPHRFKKNPSNCKVI